jgi:hypothetical protein
MIGELKSEIINNAYSRGRISGLTSNPTGSQVNKALNRLEMMMALWEGKNIRVGYNFEDDPDINSPHNVDRKYWEVIETSLACGLLSDFRKEPTVGLMRSQKGSYSVLLSSTAQRRQVQYPGRMPLGRGNRVFVELEDSYYPDTEPLPFDTVYLFVGDIDDYVEGFASWLATSEDISSYVISVDGTSGLTIVSDSLSTPDVSYRLQAVTAGTYEIKIVVTSSTGRIKTVVKTYQVEAS